MENKILGLQASSELKDIYALEVDSQINFDNEHEVTLDYMSWGKNSNLQLYFTILESDKKMRLSVFNRNRYMDREENISFKNTDLLGKNFVFNMKITKNNYLNLIKATLK